MTAHPTARLSALVDDELDGPERTEVEAHLAACAECRAVAADLRALAGAAAAWPTAAPPADLWPGIAARLETRGSTVVPFAPARPGAWRDRRVSLSLPQLALAASLLIAVSGAVAWLAGQRGPSPASAGPAVIAIAEPSGTPAAGEVRVTNFADAQYDAAVEDLERVLREQRDELDPRTVQVLQKNLQAIDAAIAEARAALAQDPANTFLTSHLVDARRRKLDLLRRAALITEGD